jgi:hypothetical protein
MKTYLSILNSSKSKKTYINLLYKGNLNLLKRLENNHKI